MILLFEFEFDFLSIRLLDILDILIVGYLIYQLYKLLRGSIAFNIFIGALLLYGFWLLVNALEMHLLTSLLGQFVSLGVIMVLIVFQPEVRRFLLLLGNTTLKQRSHFFSRLIDRANTSADSQEKINNVAYLKAALLKMSKDRTGALLVFASKMDIEFFSNSGVKMNAEISQPLIESIFCRDSPLHDGAVIISDNKIFAASCILPISNNPDLPKSIGLRHRAGLGATENSDMVAFIVSEESGEISCAFGGTLSRNLGDTDLKRLLLEKYP